MSETAKVFRVAIENVMGIWPQVEPLVAKELAVIPTHDVDDVRRMVLSNQLHLWVQWSDHVEAMAVTEFASYPRGLALRVWLGAAGDGEKLSRVTLVSAIKQWARYNRCKWIDACGRVGWLRVFSDAKFSGVFMRLTVDWSEAQ
jgi:hypothetical protein